MLAMALSHTFDPMFMVGGMVIAVLIGLLYLKFFRKQVRSIDWKEFREPLKDQNPKSDSRWICTTPTCEAHGKVYSTERKKTACGACSSVGTHTPRKER